MKRHYVYDIEIYRNYIYILFKDIETNKYYSFRHLEHIGYSNNNMNKLPSFLNRDLVLYGYNSKNFDKPLMQFISSKIEEKKQYFKVQECFEFSSNIIQKGREFNTQKWNILKYLKNKKNWTDMDVLQDIEDRCSLKELQCRMGYKYVEDLPFNPSVKITPYMLEELESYCQNDVDSTDMAREFISKAIETRKTLSRLYKIDEDYGASLTNAKLVEVIFANFGVKNIQKEKLSFCKYKMPVNYTFENKDLQNVKELFESNIVKWEMKEIDGKEKAVSNEAFFKPEVWINGLKTQFGVGGWHGAKPNSIYRKSKTHSVFHLDGAGYYPSMMKQFNFFPRKLTHQAFEELIKIINLRNQLKYDKSSKNDEMSNAYKLVLNTFYGITGTHYYDTFDKQAQYSICFTGQLLLAMLVEFMLAEEIEVFNVNTDGIYVYVPNEKIGTMNSLCDVWEELTSIKMDREEYEIILQRDVNNYIAKQIGKDKPKVKGAYLFEQNVHKKGGGHFSVVPKAVVDYIINNTKIEDTINKETDFSKFLGYTKASKSSFEGLFIENHLNTEFSKNLGHTLRYFKSKERLGKDNNDINTLYALKEESKKTDINNFTSKDRNIIIANDISSIEKNSSNLDKPSYIEKAYDLLSFIEKRLPMNHITNEELLKERDNFPIDNSLILPGKFKMKFKKEEYESYNQWKSNLANSGMLQTGPLSEYLVIDFDKPLNELPTYIKYIYGYLDLNTCFIVTTQYEHESKENAIFAFRTGNRKGKIIFKYSGFSHPKRLKFDKNKLEIFYKEGMNGTITIFGKKSKTENYVWDGEITELDLRIASTLDFPITKEDIDLDDCENVQIDEFITLLENLGVNDIPVVSKKGDELLTFKCLFLEEHNDRKGANACAYKKDGKYQAKCFGNICNSRYYELNEQLRKKSIKKEKFISPLSGSLSQGFYK